jgi:hypothetical protein
VSEFDLGRRERDVSRVMSMRPRDGAVMAVVLAEAVAAAGGDPEAAGLFVVAESLDELANCAERGEDHPARPPAPVMRPNSPGVRTLT